MSVARRVSATELVFLLRCSVSLWSAHREERSERRRVVGRILEPHVFREVTAIRYREDDVFIHGCEFDFCVSAVLTSIAYLDAR